MSRQLETLIARQQLALRADTPGDWPASAAGHVGRVLATGSSNCYQLLADGREGGD